MLPSLTVRCHVATQLEAAGVGEVQIGPGQFMSPDPEAGLIATGRRKHHVLQWQDEMRAGRWPSCRGVGDIGVPLYRKDAGTFRIDQIDHKFLPAGIPGPPFNDATQQESLLARGESLRQELIIDTVDVQLAVLFDGVVTEKCLEHSVQCCDVGSYVAHRFVRGEGHCHRPHLQTVGVFRIGAAPTVFVGQ